MTCPSAYIVSLHYGFLCSIKLLSPSPTYLKHSGRTKQLNVTFSFHCLKNLHIKKKIQNYEAIKQVNSSYRIMLAYMYFRRLKRSISVVFASK